jgi:hypothetical protein
MHFYTRAHGFIETGLLPCLEFYAATPLAWGGVHIDQ